ncbi:hypothetical protein HPB51_019222 [Rhipicephalus microplus]|uniref:Uncharacterized protein n=1 Tax=Rhipicephalus microplus TaxID=6941 RepID=A0A9J6DBG4_RHIMP|nr:hypothetical protein HPB51_019222 [Rhipicephalus microplus]
MRRACCLPTLQSSSDGHAERPKEKPRRLNELAVAHGLALETGLFPAHKHREGAGNTTAKRDLLRAELNVQQRQVAQLDCTHRSGSLIKRAASPLWQTEKTARQESKRAGTKAAPSLAKRVILNAPRDKQRGSLVQACESERTNPALRPTERQHSAKYAREQGREREKKGIERVYKREWTLATITAWRVRGRAAKASQGGRNARECMYARSSCRRAHRAPGLPDLQAGLVRSQQRAPIRDSHATRTRLQECAILPPCARSLVVPLRFLRRQNRSPLMLGT